MSEEFAMPDEKVNLEIISSALIAIKLKLKALGFDPVITKPQLGVDDIIVLLLYCIKI